MYSRSVPVLVLLISYCFIAVCRERNLGLTVSGHGETPFPTEELADR